MIGNNVVLVVESPAELRGMRLPIADGGAVLGRYAELSVPDTTVSARHAKVWWHSDSLWIEDSGSTNGTLVNGRRIDAAIRIAAGDTVTLGGVNCRVEQAGTDAGLWPPLLTHGRVDAAGPPEPTQRPEPTQPLAAGWTESTRYLCAATHLDEAFCGKVIRHTIDQSYRALRPRPAWTRPWWPDNAGA